MNLVFLLLVFGVPFLVALFLVFGSKRTGWITLCLTLFMLMSSIYGGFVAPWFSYSYWLLALMLLIVAVAALVTLFRLRSAFWTRPSFKGFILIGVLVSACIYYGHFISSALSSTKKPVQSTDLEFPLRDGVYAISQGGSGPPLQQGHARISAQKYAIDVVKLNGTGTSGGPWLGDNTATANILGETVFSPCAGKVTFVRNGLPNSPVFDSQEPAGNIIVLECNNIIIAFAHLETNSIPLKIGDSVSTGEPIGKVGMSGRTLGPHLHFHAESGQWQGDFSENPPAALTFNERFMWQNRLVDQRR